MLVMSPIKERHHERLTRPAQTSRKENHIPDAFLKGVDFESYVRDYLFSKDKYTLIERTPDHRGKDAFVFSSKEPDFKLQSESGKTFLLEAKYRDYFFDGLSNGANSISYRTIGKLTVSLRYM